MPQPSDEKKTNPSEIESLYQRRFKARRGLVSFAHARLAARKFIGEHFNNTEKVYGMEVSIRAQTSIPANALDDDLILMDFIDEQERLINTPELEDFDKAIVIEAAHQVRRWGTSHDSCKAPMDWFWLIGYLAGKALAANLAGDKDKAKHHCISTAAALRNWHAHIRTDTSIMRPGADNEKM